MIDFDKKMERDFLDFTNSKGLSPPESLSYKVLNFVQADLNPSHKVVFSKLLGIQAFIGFLTLIFCPQFDFSLTNNYELFHYFHYAFGIYICSAICGALFVGSGAVFSAYLLRSSEVRKIKEFRFLYYFAVSILAMGGFFLLGAKIYLTLSLYWLIGATLGGIMFFELNTLIRKSVLNLQLH